MKFVNKLSVILVLKHESFFNHLGSIRVDLLAILFLAFQVDTNQLYIACAAPNNAI